MTVASLPDGATIGSSDAVDALARIAFVPGWVVVGAVTVAFLFGASLPLELQLLPLVASVVVLGLPHGAVDHLAVPRTRNETLTPRWLALVGGLYLLVGGVYAAVWFLAPVAAFAFFILLTWAHWGQGEIYPLVRLARVSHLDARWRRGLTALTRGALPMLVPLVAFPDQYRRVAATLVGLFDTDAADALAVAFSTEARLAVGTLLAVLVAATLLVGLYYSGRNDRRAWALEAGETLLLVAFFSAVPPLFAIGVYFCVWHSLRHVARLLAIDEAAVAALADGRTSAALARFAREATPLTIGALACFGLLYHLLPSSASSPLEAVGVYLVCIAAVTLPHVLIVTWMDERQGLWTPG